MSTRREVLVGLLTLPLGLAGCRFGGWGRGFRESELGCRVELRSLAGSDSVVGELLLARDDGLVVLVGGRVLFAPWDALSRASFEGVPVERVRDAVPPTPVHLSRIRQVSRYPFDLTEPQMAALLEHHGQAEMERYR